MFAVAVTIGTQSVLLLQLAAVRQQDFCQGACRWRAINRPAESFLNESRQVAAVIKMSVRQHDSVDLGRSDWKGLPVTLTQSFHSLEETAVDQHSCIPLRDKIPRAGHRAGGAKKL
ncbi:hypothetical protein OF001_U330003 [Pseudomonas sp. OF001]|nr:hypothetical protein OF001_U330003 [Pseudomonas sp. OF001]